MSSPQKHQVVVIDDNCDAADTFAMFLDLDGHQVHTEYSGADGVDAIRAHRPDIIFCDIGMPGMNGYDVACAVRRLDHGYRPLLVATTGWGDEETRRQTAAAGFDLHLVKPLMLAEVPAILQERHG